MNNFTFHNPTRLLFGKGMIEKLSTAIPMVHRIMITFGGGSVKQNGVYDQVIKALKDRDYIEFWGIEPNPTIETLREAIQIAKGKQVDFLLAVGGGSVIDEANLRWHPVRRRSLGIGTERVLLSYRAHGYRTDPARHGFRDE